MHRFPLFLLILAILGFFSSAQMNAAQIHPFDMIALSILEEAQDPAICGVDDDNVYLNSENIVVEKEGIFLSTGDRILFKLNSVCSNENGIYTQISKLNSPVAVVWPAIIKCKNCKKPFSINIFNGGVCPHCGTQN